MFRQENNTQRAAEGQKVPLEIRIEGILSYEEALGLQERLCLGRQEEAIANTIIICQHEPVITLGAGRDRNMLLANETDLAKQGIALAAIRRGGGATAHNPGQLVIYPIIRLSTLGLGISDYVRLLEATGIELIGQFGLDCHRRSGYPGLWTGQKKIASIGVQVRRWVTMHGMAINICNDLSIFKYIVPCGIEGVEMTSVEKEIKSANPSGRAIDISEAIDKIEVICRANFSWKRTITDRRITGSSDDGQQAAAVKRRLAPWLKRPLPAGAVFNHTARTLDNLSLQTICTNAGCPNRGLCWGRGTATVLILGNICTRNCRFCLVGHGKPKPPEPDEPQRIAQMALQMGLKYLVITSVDRDDLPDGGARHFADVVNQCRKELPCLRFELLVPDFKGCQDRAIEILSSALPFVFGHNIETVPSLYPKARPGGDYRLSLGLLDKVKKRYPDVFTKSSIMLGLGEKEQEVAAVLAELRSVGCDRIAIGQYLRPSKGSLEVAEYIRPEKFEWWGQKAKEMGFSWVMSSPFTRSSFEAERGNT